MDDKTVAAIVGQSVRVETVNGPKQGVAKGTRQAHSGRMVLVEYPHKEGGKVKQVRSWFDETEVRL